MKIIIGQPPRPGHGGSIVIGDLSEHELALLIGGLGSLLVLEQNVEDERVTSAEAVEIMLVRDFLYQITAIAGSGEFRPVAPAEEAVAE